MGHTCKCKQLFWTVRNSLIYHKRPKMPNVTKATNERPMTIPRTTLEVPPVPSSVSSSTVLEFVMPNSGLLVHTVCLLVVVDVVTVVVVVDFVVVFLKK